LSPKVIKNHTIWGQVEVKVHNRPVPPVTIADLNDRDVFDDRQYLNDELKDMFFKLDLIQSYGSGIRRAKKSPKKKVIWIE
jgi:predicted HTH transcriptional regulator